MEQRPKAMRARGTRKLSDVSEAPEEEAAEPSAEEGTAPVKVNPEELSAPLRHEFAAQTCPMVFNEKDTEGCSGNHEPYNSP